MTKNLLICYSLATWLLYWGLDANVNETARSSDALWKIAPIQGKIVHLSVSLNSATASLILSADDAYRSRNKLLISAMGYLLVRLEMLNRCFSVANRKELVRARLLPKPSLTMTRSQRTCSLWKRILSRVLVLSYSTTKKAKTSFTFQLKSGLKSISRDERTSIKSVVLTW